MNKSPSSNWLQCSSTKSRLAYIDSIIESTIDTRDANFRRLALHTAKKGGKKLRPSLYFLSLNIGDYYDNELLYPAAALELIHIASLYHDDVMDRAELRRNSISVNAKWGNVNTVYSGNYLFSKAISMLSNYNNTRINEITCQYVSDLCLGQLKETENAYNLHVTKEEHLDIIKKKTASLFELPCIIGATLAQADSSAIEALVQYSQNIGIAFQMIDDLLDLSGNPAKTGKTLGTDLKEGVYTYATIHALHSKEHSKELSNLLMLENLEDTDIDKAIELIKNSGGIKVAKNKAQEHIQKAINSLSFMPQNTTKQSFMNLAKFIISRDH
jgi:heptaprenyl diphosphate synthase